MPQSLHHERSLSNAGESALALITSVCTAGTLKECMKQTQPHMEGWQY